MGILAGIFKARDKPQNATSWSAYPFFYWWKFQWEEC